MGLIYFKSINRLKQLMGSINLPIWYCPPIANLYEGSYVDRSV